MENCYSNENNADSGMIAKGHWRSVEDCKLIKLVALHGPQNWYLIAKELQGRSGKSCRLRWVNQLDPSVNRSKFSEEEIEKLISAHKMFGNRWAMIAGFFRGRTDNAIKNLWHVLKGRKRREEEFVACRKRKPKQLAQSRWSTEEGTKGKCFLYGSKAFGKTRCSSNASGSADDSLIIYPSSASDWSTSRVSSSELSVITENSRSGCFTVNPSPPFIDFLRVEREYSRSLKRPEHT